MASFTICNDLGAQENIVCDCFHFFPSNYTVPIIISPIVLERFTTHTCGKSPKSLSFTHINCVCVCVCVCVLLMHLCVVREVRITMKYSFASLTKYEIPLQSHSIYQSPRGFLPTNLFWHNSHRISSLDY